jgi:hypothetical protein
MDNEPKNKGNIPWRLVWGFLCASFVGECVKGFFNHQPFAMFGGFGGAVGLVAMLALSKSIRRYSLVAYAAGVFILVLFFSPTAIWPSFLHINAVSNSENPHRASYLENIRATIGDNQSPDFNIGNVYLVGTAEKPISRLKVFLTYSGMLPVPPPGELWEKPTQTFLGEIDDKVEGQQVRFRLTYSNKENLAASRWSAERVSGYEGAQQTPIRVLISLVGPNGITRQEYAFIKIGGYIINAHNLMFAKNWEKQLTPH